MYKLDHTLPHLKALICGSSELLTQAQLSGEPIKPAFKTFFAMQNSTSNTEVSVSALQMLYQ